MSESSMPHKVCSSTLVLNILMTILMIKSRAENGGQRVIIPFSFFSSKLRFCLMSLHEFLHLQLKKIRVLRIPFVTDYNAFDKLCNHVFKQVIIIFSKLLWLST